MSDFKQQFGYHYGVVTALPTTPVDGGRIIYTDSRTAPNYRWEFMYNQNSTSAYKWQCIGGTPWHTYSDAAATITATGAGTAHPTSPISMTIPLAGDWDIHLRCWFQGSGGGFTVVESYAVGGTAASTTWGVLYGVATNGILTSYRSGEMPYRHTALAGTPTVSENTWISGSGHQVGRRSIRIMPVRVG